MLWLLFVGLSSGAMSNSRRWQKSTPASIRSPFFAQADLGFIFFKKKKYGMFFVAVNTFTRRIFCQAIKNNKSETLISALEAMMKDKQFRLVKTLLFDGESGLKSKSAQKSILEKFQLKVHAEAGYKRTMVERTIREIKLRIALALEQNREPFSRWKNVLDNVITLLNVKQEKTFKSNQDMLTTYFTQPTTVLPQSDSSMFRYDIDDRVQIDLTPTQRRALNFKWSLHKGNTTLESQQCCPSVLIFFIV